MPMTIEDQQALKDLWRDFNGYEVKSQAQIFGEEPKWILLECPKCGHIEHNEVRMDPRTGLSELHECVKCHHVYRWGYHDFPRIDLNLQEWIER